MQRCIAAGARAGDEGGAASAAAPAHADDEGAQERVQPRAPLCAGDQAARERDPSARSFDLAVELSQLRVPFSYGPAVGRPATGEAGELLYGAVAHTTYLLLNVATPITYTT